MQREQNVVEMCPEPLQKNYVYSLLKGIVARIIRIYMMG